ncbi:phosphomannomutase/phosphoglucomutase [Candidatus Fermentibacterales bacterium]|nr:phosphomannomutase/phosphoglucomutase [Candidatus Fermentibacterales bacterium]
MDRSIFRMYDVRGVAGAGLDESTVFMLGRELSRRAGGEGARMAVGRDCRPSGGQLFEWLARGICSTGASVIDLGVQTTPMTYFACYALDDPEATVMITGSHNPPEYNGFKMMLGRHTLYGPEIAGLADSMEDSWTEPFGEAHADRVDLYDRYTDRLVSEFCLGRPLRVVVDGGNGTGGGVACDVLGRLGCEVVPIFCEMDGSFPNHHPDPTVPSNLRDLRWLVLSEKADLGVAYDGDADRLGVVDERGEIVWGDRVLILLARALLRSYPGAVVISEVKASRLFFSEVEKAGGRPLMSATGHSIIKKNMIEQNALLAGEMSGHVFFRDRYYGYDDALYATLRLLEVLSDGEEPLSRRLSDLPEVVSTPEIREACPEEQKAALVDRVRRRLSDRGYEVDTTDGVRIEFPDGWGLLRASNTQPVLVMRFEASSRERLDEYERIVRETLAQASEEEPG